MIAVPRDFGRYSDRTSKFEAFYRQSKCVDFRTRTFHRSTCRPREVPRHGRDTRGWASNVGRGLPRHLRAQAWQAAPYMVLIILHFRPTQLRSAVRLTSTLATSRSVPRGLSSAPLENAGIQSREKMRSMMAIFFSPGRFIAGKNDRSFSSSPPRKSSGCSRIDGVACRSVWQSDIAVLQVGHRQAVPNSS